MHRDQIDAPLVARLVAEQFPQWAELRVAPVARLGWDNRTFRLGDELTVRLPSAESYVASVEKEQVWLPRLAPHLPLPIPAPLALGRPSGEYPWPWSVRRWLAGRPPNRADVDVAFARDLAAFLVALRGVPAGDGPIAGAHNFFRGCSPAVYDEETRAALAALGPRVDPRAEAVWEEALAATRYGDPVWFHGDVAAGNLLVDASGRLAAVIDFGTCGVGDPACDLVVTWTLLHGTAREAFRNLVPADDAMWARARGWLLWKSLITLADPAVDPAVAGVVRREIDDVLAERA